MIIYRTDERIPIKLGHITVYVSPLSQGQYANLMSQKSMSGGVEISDGAAMSMMALKFAVKDVESNVPIEYRDGTKFKLQQDESGKLTDESIYGLTQVLGAPEMNKLAEKVLLNKFADDTPEGVAVIGKRAGTKKKRRGSVVASA